MRYRLELRLGPADAGRRVVIRWRRPAPGGGDEVADVLGILEAADDSSFTVRKASGEAVVIPRERALGGKTVPPPARRSARRGSGPGTSACLLAVGEMVILCATALLLTSAIISVNGALEPSAEPAP